MASDLRPVSEVLEEQVEDLLGVLQDLHYRIEHCDDLDGYGVREAFLFTLHETLLRYDAVE